MEIKFTVTKGHPRSDPGRTVSAHEFNVELERVQRLMIMDFGKDKPDHINLMFEGSYQIWVFSETSGTRVTLFIP